MMPDKDRIRQRFTRAAATYDNQAVIQHRVADRLLTLLNKHLHPPPSRILEIGCCTGLMTSRLVKLLSRGATLYVNDLVPDFEPTVLARVNKEMNAAYLGGDIESITLPGELDLVISSSTFHWVENLPALLHRLQEKMTAGSILAFSMYSTDNLRELREITGIGLQYYSLDQMKKIASKYFTVVAEDEERVAFGFHDPLELLHHLRETGVNSLDGTPWNRSRLNTFISQYQNRFKDQGRVMLTYHPAYVIARKKN